MELQRIVWTWDLLIHRLRESEPDLGQPVGRSCRPIEAERRQDGRLTIALGCWLAADLALLAQEFNRARMDNAIGEVLGDHVQVILVAWPGGLAPPAATTSGKDIPPPEILVRPSTEAREEAVKCESPIQRLFFARAAARGIALRCQYPVLTYRLDFAVPRLRMAAEVAGWDWHRSGRGKAERRDREQHLGMEGWRVIWFSGVQVLENVDRCLDEFIQLVPAMAGIRMGGGRLVGRGSRQGFRHGQHREKRQ